MLKAVTQTCANSRFESFSSKRCIWKVLNKIIDFRYAYKMYRCGLVVEAASAWNLCEWMDMGSIIGLAIGFFIPR